MVICGHWLHSWEQHPQNPRYQYCKRCGRVEPIECSHYWLTVKEEPVYSKDGRHIGFQLYLRCQSCGEVKSKLITPEIDDE